MHIKHSGILGQKWGRRRYQNKDGSLTEEGRRRYSQYNGKLTSKDFARKDYQAKSDIISGVRSGVNSISTFERNTRSKNTNTKKLNLSNMTDKELKDAINRENLERQYNQLFNPSSQSKISKGRQYAVNVLETVGLTLGVAASAITIAKGINDLLPEKLIKD